MCSIRWALHVGNWTPTETEWLYAARCIQQEEKDKIGRKGFAKDSKRSMVNIENVALRVGCRATLTK